jgi:CBS domain-containing protein
VSQLEALAPAQRAVARVLDIADRDPQLTVAEDEDVARLLERPAFVRSGRAVVVDQSGRPVGLVSITDVQRALRASRLTDRAPSIAPPV